MFSDVRLSLFYWSSAIRIGLLEKYFSDVLWVFDIRRVDNGQKIKGAVKQCIE